MTEQQKQAKKEAQIARLEERLQQEISPVERNLIESTLKLLKPAEEVVESEE